MIVLYSSVLNSGLLMVDATVVASATPSKAIICVVDAAYACVVAAGEVAVEQDVSMGIKMAHAMIIEINFLLIIHLSKNIYF
jgi:hypothetical protein